MLVYQRVYIYILCNLCIIYIYIYYIIPFYGGYHHGYHLTHHFNCTFGWGWNAPLIHGVSGNFKSLILRIHGSSLLLISGLRASLNHVKPRVVDSLGGPYRGPKNQKFVVLREVGPIRSRKGLDLCYCQLGALGVSLSGEFRKNHLSLVVLMKLQWISLGYYCNLYIYIYYIYIYYDIYIYYVYIKDN